MRGYLDRTAEPLLVVEDYSLDASVKLSHPITTPGGSRVTLLSFCVNVHYSMDKEGNPVIHGVQLWQPDDRVTDVVARCNVFATHRGRGMAFQSCQPRVYIDVGGAS